MNECPKRHAIEDHPSDVIGVYPIGPQAQYEKRDARGADGRQELKGVFRGAVTVYLTFTFLIFSTMLYDGTMTYSLLIFHYLLPIVFICEWVLTESDMLYQWRYVGAWVIYPLVYLGGS